MRLTSPIGRFERADEGPWCFIPDLPPFHRLQSLERLARDTAPRLAAYEAGDAPLPEDLEMRLGRMLDYRLPPGIAIDDHDAAKAALVSSRSMSVSERLVIRRALLPDPVAPATITRHGCPDIPGGGTSLRSVLVKVTVGGPRGTLCCPPPAAIEPLLDGLDDALARQAGSDLAAAIMSYVYIIFVHPLIDGNGRLARAVLDAVWARSLPDRRPLLIAPLFKLFHDTVSRGLVDLMMRGGWPHVIWLFSTILDAYCQGVERALRTEGPARCG